MLQRLFLAAVAACLIAAPAEAASPPGGPRLELTRMMGRWYEVARVPNALQSGCAAGASEWKPAPNGFAVVQSCHKGSPTGPVKEWRAKATVADPATNAKFRMTFFGGLVSQEYRVLDHSLEQGWLVLATANGKYLWLMSQRPTLPSVIRAQALGRIKQLGFDTARLEFPAPAGD
jgi:apolipoprotein D and lipocalin family protein